MKIIKKASLVDQVYNQIKNEIISLKRPLGSKLNVNELQDVIGVSSTPIREAVNRLQQDGLVIYENNIGAHILELKPHDIVEIQQLALGLHSMAIKFAIETGSKEKIVSDLETYLEDYKNARTANAEAAAVNKILGVYYHNCGNNRLDKSMIAIQGQQMLLRNLYASACEKRAQDAECYEGMLKATAEGDIQKAIDILSENVEKMTDTLINKLKDLK